VSESIVRIKEHKCHTRVYLVGEFMAIDANRLMRA